MPRSTSPAVLTPDAPARPAAGLGRLIPARVRRSRRGEEQARWRELLAVDEVVVGLDCGGRVTLLSGLGQRLFQVTAEQAFGRDWCELTVDPDERNEARERLEMLFRSSVIAPEFVEFEHAVVTIEGRRLFRWRATLSERDGEVVGCIASGIDITEQRDAQEQLLRDQDDLTQLVAIARAVGRETDARASVVEGIAPLAKAQIVSLCELDEDGAGLTITYCTDSAFAGMRFPLASDQPSGVGFAFASGKPLFIAEAEGHPLINQEMVRQTGLHSVMYEPIHVAGQIVAVLTVGWTASNVVLGGPRTRLVSVAAGEAAMAVERARSLRALQDAALADALTGIPNRRAFDAQLRAAIDVARGTGNALAVAMMDLNGFKVLNDTEGHDAGDRVLKECASLWTAELRPGDLLARFGGDEFAVILPTCGDDAAEPVARRLRDAVRHPAGSGVGIAVWDRSENAEELLRRADQALYADKAARSRALADPERLAALFASGLLDAPEDPELQSLTETLTHTLGVPVAALGLATSNDVVYPCETGFDGELAETRRLKLSQTYCQYPAATGRELVVGDTAADPRLADNFSTTELGLRAYAGVPLKLGEVTIGVLCAASDQPKEWTPEQLGALRMAADHVTRRLQRQRDAHEAAELSANAKASRAERAKERRAA